MMRFGEFDDRYPSSGRVIGIPTIGLIGERGKDVGVWKSGRMS
jgi:hypothetical protein